MAENWVKFHESLVSGFWHGVPRTHRFILMELSMHAKPLQGVSELPYGTKDHVSGLVELRLHGRERRMGLDRRYSASDIPE